MNKRMIWRLFLLILCCLCITPISLHLYADFSESSLEATDTIDLTDPVVSTTLVSAVKNSATTQITPTTTVHFTDDDSAPSTSISSVTPQSFSSECATVTTDTSDHINDSVENITCSTTMVPIYEERIVITEYNDSSYNSITQTSTIADSANTKATTKVIQTTKESQKTTEKTTQATKEMVTTTNIVTTTVTTTTVTTTTVTTTTETTTVTFQEENAILLPTETAPVEVTIAPAYQSYVDSCEIVQDNGELFSTENNILLFGHYFKTFSCLDQIVVGDEIILWNDYIPKTYTVITCAHGSLNEYNTDILDSDGNSLLFSKFDDSTSVIRLITCEGIFNPNGRIVIIAVAEV